MQNAQCRISDFVARQVAPGPSTGLTDDEVIRNPHSALRHPHSALRTPHSAFFILHSPFCLSSRSGQAMVELIVALIVIVVLLAGLIQIGQITAAHSRTMIAARSEAAQAAMADTYPPPAGANYIYTWIAGPDGKPYTRDDTPLVLTNATDDTRTLVEMARPDELEELVPGNDLSTLGMSADSMDEFFLVRGHDSESCAILKAIQNLAYDQESISVRSDAWLVWMEGIY